MKVELEFELLKDVSKIEDLIAGRVFSMDCVDKSKDVKARVIEPVKVQNQCDGCAIGAPINNWGNHMYPDGTRMACTKSRYETAHTDHPARHWDRSCPACNASVGATDLLEWPKLITLPVRHMPEGEKA